MTDSHRPWGHRSSIKIVLWDVYYSTLIFWRICSCSWFFSVPVIPRVDITTADYHPIGLISNKVIVPSAHYNTQHPKQLSTVRVFISLLLFCRYKYSSVLRYDMFPWLLDDFIFGSDVRCTSSRGFFYNSFDPIWKFLEKKCCAVYILWWPIFVARVPVGRTPLNSANIRRPT